VTTKLKCRTDFKKTCKFVYVKITYLDFGFSSNSNAVENYFINDLDLVRMAASKGVFIQVLDSILTDLR